MGDLFDSVLKSGLSVERIGDQAVVLRGFAVALSDRLLPELERIQNMSPFRNMTTPGGFKMSVALTNCGRFGWISDRRGYRYTRIDPETCQPWPDMPEIFMLLAQRAAKHAGFQKFEPDACLINQYEPGTRLSLHQDKDERSFDHPIVSVSLGIPAIFLFGGEQRSDHVRKIELLHGDVVVWGGKDRLRYHGVSQLKSANHPVLGPKRINFTFRAAG